MTINIRFFASLRERIGHATLTVEADGIASARDVWKAVSGESPDEEILVAIKNHYEVLDRAVADGDEVAFFPPVTGG